MINKYHSRQRACISSSVVFEIDHVKIFVYEYTCTSTYHGIIHVYHVPMVLEYVRTMVRTRLVEYHAHAYHWYNMCVFTPLIN